MADETEERRAMAMRLYCDPVTGALHPISGIGVPIDGCHCKNCREERHAMYEQQVARLRAYPEASAIGLTPWQERAIRIRALTKRNPLLLSVDLARGPDRTVEMVMPVTGFTSPTDRAEDGVSAELQPAEWRPLAGVSDKMQLVYAHLRIAALEENARRDNGGRMHLWRDCLWEIMREGWCTKEAIDDGVLTEDMTKGMGWARDVNTGCWHAPGMVFDPGTFGYRRPDPDRVGGTLTEMENLTEPTVYRADPRDRIAVLEAELAVKQMLIDAMIDRCRKWAAGMSGAPQPRVDPVGGTKPTAPPLPGRALGFSR